MSILSNPRTLYFTRIIQLLFGIGFLVLISDAGVHRGWWKDINGALAVGVIATILTFALTLHALVTHHLKSNPFSGGSNTRTILRLVIETLAFLLWIAAVVLMLRPKGGCPRRDTREGIEFCIWGTGDKDFERADGRPLTRWNVGVAFGVVEIVSFIISGLLVFKEDRATKVTGGGASYA